MIGKLTGTLERSEGGSIIVEVGGVGYLVRVPLATLALMPGSLVSLHVHTAVREDAIDLYGFETAEELAFFKQLTSVAGVGPKTALGVLNVADVASLTRSIAAGDASALTKVFGIGKKSAERIVVELKDKIVHTSPSTPLGATSSNDVEIIEALMALGYGAAECRAAIKDIGAEGAGGLRERLGAALKRLGARHAA